MQTHQRSLAERLALNPGLRAEFLGSLGDDEKRGLEASWAFWARPKQLPPPGDWRFWLILAGRGFGKSRTGAEWVKQRIESGRCGRIALVAETSADARDVMVEGESGLLACATPGFRPKYEPSKRRVTWPNGAVATTYSAEEPDQLRGPQHDAAWCDELAKWRYAEAWDQLNFGLRLGDDPRAIITTTPRPTPIIKALVADPLAVVTRGSTFENRGNVAGPWLRSILRKYQGTRLGRQELEAEILDDAPGALWKRAEMIDAHRVNKSPELARIVVAVDPNVSSDGSGDESDRDQPACGIVVVGLGEDGHGYVLADRSLLAPRPEQWANQVVSAFHTFEADRVIGEVNNGGDLVESNVRTADQNVPFKQVRASRGKRVRAEPVSSLAEKGYIHHVGSLPELEDELCQWEPSTSTWSPNRLDALVWGITDLMLGEQVGDGRTIHIRSDR